MLTWIILVVTFISRFSLQAHLNTFEGSLSVRPTLKVHKQVWQRRSKRRPFVILTEGQRQYSPRNNRVKANILPSMVHASDI